MMKYRIWLAAVVGCSALWLGMASGCSGDDSKNDGGPDAIADSTFDAIQDVQVGDAGSDVADAADGSYDSSALFQFPGEELTAFCQRLQTCCFGAVDAGSMATCESLASAGLEGNLGELTNYPHVVDGGNLRLDTTAAASCLAGLATLTCGVANLSDGGGTSITATEYATATANCYQAIYGTIPIGQEGCQAAIECVPGARCVAATAADGGATTECVALEGNGQGPCAANSNWDCQYRGYLGNPSLTCEVNADGGTSCQPKLANGANCTYSFECASGLCNQYANPSCAATGPFLDPLTCDALFGVDAGQ